MVMRKPGAGGLVYSTEGGRMCPTCRQPVGVCLCNAKAGNVGKGDGIVRISREGRAGKTVTVVRGVPLVAAELADLGKRIRVACGSGGTAKDGVLEVQGDHVARLMQMLQEQGWAVKRSGG